MCQSLGSGLMVKTNQVHTISPEECLVPSSLLCAVKGSHSHWNVKNAAVAKTMESEQS